MKRLPETIGWRVKAGKSVREMIDPAIAARAGMTDAIARNSRQPHSLQQCTQGSQHDRRAPQDVPPASSCMTLCPPQLTEWNHMMYERAGQGDRNRAKNEETERATYYSSDAYALLLHATASCCLESSTAL